MLHNVCNNDEIYNKSPEFLASEINRLLKFIQHNVDKLQTESRLKSIDLESKKPEVARQPVNKKPEVSTKQLHLEKSSTFDEMCKRESINNLLIDEAETDSDRLRSHIEARRKVLEQEQTPSQEQPSQEQKQENSKVDTVSDIEAPAKHVTKLSKYDTTTQKNLMKSAYNEALVCMKELYPDRDHNSSEFMSKVFSEANTIFESKL
jgi:hypothetical protein